MMALPGSSVPVSLQWLRSIDLVFTNLSNVELFSHLSFFHLQNSRQAFHCIEHMRLFVFAGHFLWGEVGPFCHTVCLPFSQSGSGTNEEPAESLVRVPDPAQHSRVR